MGSIRKVETLTNPESDPVETNRQTEYQLRLRELEGTEGPKSEENSHGVECRTGVPLDEQNVCPSKCIVDLWNPNSAFNVKNEGTQGAPAEVSSVLGLTKTGKFTPRQWTTLFSFASANLFMGMVFSLQAPFYPAEAEKKGATATEYGFVFGVYELIMILASPIFGKYVNKLRPRLMFNVGISTTATSCILFGLLDKIDNHMWFISLSFVLRIIEAVGCSSFVISSYTLIASEFPDSVATTFALLETFFGFGMILGPAAGGALYQLGGYYLPFAVTGGCLVTIAILSSFFMPKTERISDEDGNVAKGFGILSILKIPSVFIGMLSVTMMGSTVGFLSATLEPHLRQFSLNPLQTGLVFVINGGVYAISSPVFGWICDKTSKLIYVTILGSVLVFFGFLLIGPASFIPMNSYLWVTGAGLFMHGIGLGGTYVTGFISGLRESIKYGFPDNVSTYGVVSGLWITALSVGGFIGPSLGGILLDHFGFRKASYYGLLSPVFMITVLILYSLKSHSSKNAAIKEVECVEMSNGSYTKAV